MYKWMFFALLCPVMLLAQQPSQVLRGQVLDAVTGRPLEGATILLRPGGLGGVANEGGRFRIAQVPVGRYEVEVAFLGYETLVQSEVPVESGREQVLQFQLSPTSAALEEVVVMANRSSAPMLMPLSAKTITIDQVRRFPASYYDPGRLAAAYAGVVNTNDQANGLSIRGQSPNNMAWQLEGIQILNPNHTPNAGTFADRTTLNSGGVNMLSAQLLDNSRLYTGAFAADQGNALSGVLDMGLRPGNNEQHEFTAQAGLIGLDITAEGPFAQNSKASFLVNYRYSTVGLLTLAGIDFGEEAINFQDLAFHLVFPGRRGGRLTLFGMGGMSSNRFEGQGDPALRETDKDLFAIDYESAMGITGATYRRPVGQRGAFHLAAGVSVIDQRRSSFSLVDSLNLRLPDLYLEDDNQLSLFSGHAYFRQGLGASAYAQLGVSVRRFGLQSPAPERGGIPAQTETILAPYFSFNGDIGARLSYQLGLHVPAYAEADAIFAEPRLSLSYQLSKRWSLSAAYGRHSQMANPYYNLEEWAQPARAAHWGLGANWAMREGLSFQAELFYHTLFDAPVLENGFGLFVSFTEPDAWNWLPTALPAVSAEGRQFGLELSLEQYLSKGYYYLANLTLYDAAYRLEGEERYRDSRYNGQFISNLTVGKEWQKAKSESVTRTIGLNLRLNYLGGFREQPIRADFSQEVGYTVFDFSAGYTEKLSNFFRSDLRFYLKKSKPKYSTTLALDIQNLTNQENQAYRYYDILKQEVSERFQLSLIPILTYRVSF